MFSVEIDPEDMDFLGLSSTQSQKSSMTDSQGRFTITALSTGAYRFTARHPDMAKSSAKDVQIVADQPIAPIEITVESGGAIEGAPAGPTEADVEVLNLDGCWFLRSESNVHGAQRKEDSRVRKFRRSPSM